MIGNKSPALAKGHFVLEKLYSNLETKEPIGTSHIRGPHGDIIAIVSDEYADVFFAAVFAFQCAGEKK